VPLSNLECGDNLAVMDRFDFQNVNDRTEAFCLDRVAIK
jgi:hypothetical protein